MKMNQKKIKDCCVFCFTDKAFFLILHSQTEKLSVYFSKDFKNR